MNLGKTVFSQLMSLLPDYEFNKCDLVDALKQCLRDHSILNRSPK